MELGEWGVRVNCICPGGIVTPIFGKALGLSVEDADRHLEAVTEMFARMQPIPRPGQPRDIAAVAVFLASDESGFVNGHELVVDGGLIAGQGFSQSQEVFNAMRQMMGLPPRQVPKPE
jgi:NAD(P)-dependent dehydrogenase (short-subunit alcohol dehydrogenase family)